MSKSPSLWSRLMRRAFGGSPKTDDVAPTMQAEAEAIRHLLRKVTFTLTPEDEAAKKLCGSLAARLADETPMSLAVRRLNEQGVVVVLAIDVSDMAIEATLDQKVETMIRTLALRSDVQNLVEGTTVCVVGAAMQEAARKGYKLKHEETAPRA